MSTFQTEQVLLMVAILGLLGCSRSEGPEPAMCPAPHTISLEHDYSRCNDLGFIVTGVPSGLKGCDGRIFRESAGACPAFNRGAAARSEDCLEGCESPEVCMTMAGGYAACRVPCLVDEECGPGGACVCGPVTNVSEDNPLGETVYLNSHCVAAECRTDADCPNGRRCALSVDCCYEPLGLYCERETDECPESVEGSRCTFKAETCSWEDESFCLCD